MGGTAAPDQARMRTVAIAMSGGRAAIGAASLLAPGVASRVLGFPRGDDNASARMVGRLFAVREIALAGYTVAKVRESPLQPEVYLLNAAVDLGDAAVCALTLMGRRGLARAAFGSVALAVPFAATFLWLRGSCQD